jgi:hypothetical protein
MPRHGQSLERYPVDRLSTYTAIQEGLALAKYLKY